MALSAGNRTYYNPTHGIEWRGNLLPYNTFYALLALFLLFFFGFICRLCYSHYRFEIRKAALRQEKEREENERYKRAISEQLARTTCNGAPFGILKNSVSSATIKTDETKNSTDSAAKGELRVQFSKDVSTDISQGLSTEHRSAEYGGSVNDAFESDEAPIGDMASRL